MKTWFRIFILVVFPLAAKGQQQNIPLNREFGLINQKVMNAYENNVHTSLLPINQSFLKDLSDSILSKTEQKDYLSSTLPAQKKPHDFFDWVWQSFVHSNFLVVDTNNFYLTVDPLFNFEIGSDNKDNSNQTLSKNTRGAIVRANVGTKFSISSSFYENQVFLPQYQASYVNKTKVVPGQGRVKNFKINGFDFASSAANVTYSPNKHINLQLGTGKNFIGDGYRSLLLSDASFNYPFWKIIGTFGANNQFQYTKLNGSLSSLNRRASGSTPEALFQRKTMSTHYLSWLITKWLHVGLFESTLWQTEDANGTKPLQWQQFNPLLGMNTLTTGFEAVNHTIVGTNLKIKLPFNALVYNQFVYDGEKKYGYQIGARYAGIPNLTIQAEYNNVAPDTYSSTIALQAYTNYNENLAHPFGADFNELIGILNYKYNRFFTQLKFNNANLTVLEPTFNNPLLSSTITPITREIQTIQMHLGFMINPKNNMRFLVGINQRTQTDNNQTNPSVTEYVYVGFSTALRNLYTDF